MTPNVDKIVAVWEKEPGLCSQVLVHRDTAGERLIGCAIGSLLWGAAHYEAYPDKVTRVSAALHDESTKAECWAVLEGEYGMSERMAGEVMVWNDEAPVFDRPFDMEDAARRDYMIAKVREEWGSPSTTGGT